MSASDYIDRRFDILAFQGPAAVGTARLRQQLFNGNSGQICTGVQKLAQAWLIEFLTIRGSMRFAPTRGVDFMRLARQGFLRNETDVLAEYNFASTRIGQYLRNGITAAMPADERFLRDELLQITLSPAGLALHIEITSQAETSRKVILPIDVVPINTAF